MPVSQEVASLTALQCWPLKRLSSKGSLVHLTGLAQLPATFFLCPEATRKVTWMGKCHITVALISVAVMGVRTLDKGQGGVTVRWAAWDFIMLLGWHG